MIWLQRWNFIERARLERELWDAFERGEDLEPLVERCRGEATGVAGGEAGAMAAFRLEVWEATLRRIRRIEALMKDRKRPGQG
jgi:hypothetical protein